MNLQQLHDALADRVGDFDHVYIHWNGSDYDAEDNAYHLTIHGDGTLAYTLDFGNCPEATWHRNGRSVAVSLACCAGAVLYREWTNFGPYPPTDVQIEALAQVLAVISSTLNLPITSNVFMTHAEAAEEDGYGPSTTCERWDEWTLPQSTTWGSGGDFIRGKALWYKQQGGLYE